MPPCAAQVPAIGATGASADADAAPGSTLLLGARGDTAIRAVDCASGKELARRDLHARLSAPVSAPAGADTVYAATDQGELRAYRRPDLSLIATATLRWPAAELAASAGPDGIVVAGGEGSAPLAALDARTLALLVDYPVEPRARVSRIEHLPQRGRFAVAFSDRDEVWEIDYRRDAPPVLRGLVHDYRSNEAVPLPGRLTARPFRVPKATRDIAPGGVAYELLRVDAQRSIDVLNLEVRREIERPLPALRMPEATTIVAWSGAGRRGWAFAAAPTRVTLLESLVWKTGDIEMGGNVVALARAPGGRQVVALVDRGAPLVLVMIDPLTTRATTREPLGESFASTRALVLSADGACIAALDDRGRWLGAIATGALNQPETPTPTSSTPPTR